MNDTEGFNIFFCHSTSLEEDGSLKKIITLVQISQFENPQPVIIKFVGNFTEIKYHGEVKKGKFGLFLANMKEREDYSKGNIPNLIFLDFTQFDTMEGSHAHSETVILKSLSSLDIKNHSDSTVDMIDFLAIF
jgi:hypothetical protein